jgi:ribonuclease H
MKDTTNNIMELTAVITALEYVLEILNKEKNYNLLLNNKKNDKKMNVEIYVDSSYVLKGITEWIENWIKKDFKNVKNIELWKKLYNLKGQIEKLPSVNLLFNKVKGHNGDKYNEMVDKLASNAATEVI